MALLETFLKNKNISSFEIEEFSFKIDLFVPSFFALSKHFKELFSLKKELQKKILIFQKNKILFVKEDCLFKINKLLVRSLIVDLEYLMEENLLYLFFKQELDLKEQEKISLFIWEEYGYNLKFLKKVFSELNSFSNNISYLNSCFSFRQNFFKDVFIQAQIDKTYSWETLNFYGGSSEIGRSCYLFETETFAILVDVGVNFSKTGKYPHFETLKEKIKKICAVFITHAHMDHCGALPILISYGYKGPIYMTEPTRDLYLVLSNDYFSLVKNKDKPFEVKHVLQSLQQIICIDFFFKVPIFKFFFGCFFPAGHIIGAAMLELEDSSKERRGLFSGDINLSETHLLEGGRETKNSLNWLVCESTYGGKIQAREDLEDFEKVILSSFKKGAVLIPVFSVGRAQELLFCLYKLLAKNKEFRDTAKIYVEGLIKETNNIHVLHSRFLKKKVSQEIFFDKETIFYSDKFVYVDYFSRNKILKTKNYIVLSTSGMMSGGPILQYLKEKMEGHENTLIFVGYQAKTTLGNFILQNLESRAKIKEFLNLEKEFKMAVHSFSHFSGHSSHEELVTLVTKKLRFKPNAKVFFVHGDRAAGLSLKKEILKKKKIDIYIPKNLEVSRIC